MPKKKKLPIPSSEEPPLPHPRTNLTPPPLSPSAIITPTGTLTPFDLALATDLRDLSLVTFDILNHKTLTPSTLSHLAPDFTSTTELPDHPAQHAHDRDTHLAHVRDWMADNPGLFCKVLNCSVRLGNERRRATVWLTNVLGVTGGKGEVRLRRESVSILEWEKRGLGEEEGGHGTGRKGWICYQTRSLRGSGFLTDVLF
ncbi:hypothetical protein M409DRAFT_25184 [Zasmidium cellare ATCC 36951]|uniref:Uncharacterized protein n=1 Tax=Zasmidium cellare ATCC 36951 TaxID=1080233 RepID=A0A6A6CB89_ZASCE|nr:uncharacterized protein M409DRAFT_25184 [Zasmidium cellare ATCC 36951]KAF2164305.1 hypothetical protein M409DRAFT_25184 [Zasmidium cellare ATCC 36951]